MSINVVVEFHQFWSILKFLIFVLFPWKRRPFWKFQSRIPTLDVPLNMSVNFQKVWSNLKFLDISAVSMVTVTISKIPKTPTTLAHDKEHTIKVLMVGYTILRV